ncbi:MAG: RNA polymerase sigma factor RpoD/SigA [Chitinophagaceae bacterium]|jgi:RNA polymerase primary sigma factor|nr:RNA polymerase sigma factor RpoD/SigA [Chitinophagaceae bacterium]
MKGKSLLIINQSEISSYLKDVRKLKVMNAERERELAKIMLNPNVTNKDKDLVKKELVEGNLRFVISVCKQYQNQGLDFPDLIAEGNYGLLKAIDKFDWNKNIRFISYGVWWIKQSIIESLNDNGRTIRLPVNIVQEYQKVKKFLHEFDNTTHKKFNNLPHTVDLDLMLNEDGDTLINIIKNENAESPDHVFNTKQILREKLLNIIGILENREKIIIEDYFGLNGTTRTLEEIGEDFNLTKERVRQIKEKALKKLRNESKVLFDYI